MLQLTSVCPVDASIAFGFVPVDASIALQFVPVDASIALQFVPVDASIPDHSADLFPVDDFNCTSVCSC